MSEYDKKIHQFSGQWVSVSVWWKRREKKINRNDVRITGSNVRMRALAGSRHTEKWIKKKSREFMRHKFTGHCNRVDVRASFVHTTSRRSPKIVSFFFSILFLIARFFLLQLGNNRVFDRVSFLLCLSMRSNGEKTGEWRMNRSGQLSTILPPNNTPSNNNKYTVTI